MLLDRHCQALDRDPATISRATGGTVRVWSPRPGRADAGQADVEGTADDVLRTLLDLRGTAGVDEYIVRDDAANTSADRAVAQLDALTEVLNRLRA